MILPKQVKALQSSLVKWYDREKREMPWRNTSDPYLIWVSEVMLQQTQVTTVIPYFERWVLKFPTIESLAKAPESKVLKLWEGLGYYSRARNLQKAAQKVVAQYESQVPSKLEEIMSLPGVGRYTAGAVLSIAYEKKVPILDGNVKRILSRLLGLNENGASASSQKLLWQAAEDILPNERIGDFNQAMMELGATICLPSKPGCLFCPLDNHCYAKLKAEQHLYPPAKPKAQSKKIEVSAGVIWRGGKVYIQQRLEEGLMAGLWEFPGGKIEAGETPEECLIREIIEELGVKVEIRSKLMIVKHSYTQFRVTLHVYQCRLPKGKIRAVSCQDWKWVEPSLLSQFPFPAANKRIADSLSVK
jgi:A/G-specific adenine glycosylase